jgi:prophage regulatory protein
MMADRLMSLPEVQRATGGLGRTTIWRLERAGKFPQRRQVVGTRVAWMESEVLAWVQARPYAAPDAADAA